MNEAGLYVVPARKRRKKGSTPTMGPRPSSVPAGNVQIDYMYRDQASEVKHRVREWKRPQTTEAIAEWMDDYFERVGRGYCPEGFTVAPAPFCARVTNSGKVVAEWKHKQEKTA